MAKDLAYIATLSTQQFDVLDLWFTYSGGQMPIFRNIFVDNSLNGQGTIVFVGLNYTLGIAVPAHSQGYFPLPLPNPAKLTFGSTGGVDVPIFLHQLPMIGRVWSV